MSSVLKKNSDKLFQYEVLADSMQSALQNILWDEQSKYLMNQNGDRKDTHYYMGSLLAPAFGLLDSEKSDELVTTATRQLVDPAIGVRTVTPPDFHTAESISFFKFAGDEAGQPFYYINGGVWPHDNAWYALALKNTGRVDDALRFMKTTMTLDGIAHSPMGVPAMYEYRFADTASTEFGKIDKPSFLWAGGFYLYTLYHLFGVDEHEWNISFAGPLPSSSGQVHYSFAYGKKKEVTLQGKGKYLQSCFVDGKNLPSLVLPNEIQNANSIVFVFGNVTSPYLQNINSYLHSVRYDAKRKVLNIHCSSFLNHQTVATVISPVQPKRTLIDGTKPVATRTSSTEEGVYEIQMKFSASTKEQTLQIEF